MRMKNTILLLVVLAAGTAVFSPGLRNGFVYDDLVTIEENLFIRDWGNLQRFFSSDYYIRAEEYSFRPLVTLTYFLDWELWGLKPEGYHLTNLIWHLAVTAALFGLARKIFKDPGPAAIAAGIFSLHPAAAEAVEGISFREDLICAFFVIVGVWAALKAGRDGGTRALRKFQAVALLFFILALLAKEMAATFPLLAGAILAGDGRESFRRMRSWLVFAFLLAGAYAAARYLVLFQQGALPSVPEFGPPLTRAAIFCKSLGLYGLRAVFPVRLTVEYPDPLPGIAWGGAFAGAAILIPAGLLAAWRTAPRGEGEGARIGLAWFILALLPVLNLLPSPRLGAERFLYLPLAGFALWAGALWSRGHRIKQKTARMTLNLALGGVFLALGAGSLLRNSAWADNYALFTDAVAKSPRSSKAHHGLGNELFHRGEAYAAIREFEEALAIFPREPFYYNSLGVAYGELGRYRESRQQFEASRRLNPNDPTVLVNLAVLALRAGELDEAETHIRRYLLDRSFDPQGHLILGEIALAGGNWDKAGNAYREAIRLNPAEVAAREGLGYCLYSAGRVEEARRVWREALRYAPNNPQIREWLAATGGP